MREVTWKEFLDKERAEKIVKRKEFLNAAISRHVSVHAAAKAVNIDRRCIHNAFAAAEMFNPSSWRRLMTKEQASEYAVLLKSRVTTPNALMAIGRVDLIEFADPDLWSRLQAKMKARA